MDIWNYDPGTGELLAQTRAQPDPTPEGQAAGRYLIPGFATDSEPPKPKKGYAIVFRNKTWEHVEDCRGQTWWDPQQVDMFGKAMPVVIQQLGDERRLSRTEPAPTLEVAKAVKAFELMQECASRMQAPFQSDALGEVHSYPNAFTDQHNRIAAFALGVSCRLWCADANKVWALRSHKLAEIEQVARASQAQIMTVQYEHEGMIERLTKETDVGNVTRMQWMRR